eukprot:359034-Chlamydomonas_euryale.AAC.6
MLLLMLLMPPLALPSPSPRLQPPPARDGGSETAAAPHIAACARGRSARMRYSAIGAPGMSARSSQLGNTVSAHGALTIDAVTTSVAGGSHATGTSSPLIKTGAGPRRSTMRTCAMPATQLLPRRAARRAADAAAAAAPPLACGIDAATSNDISPAPSVIAGPTPPAAWSPRTSSA